MGGRVTRGFALISLLLDTSFLITFSNPERPHHAAARQYFREALQRQIPMYLSAIVISEFQVKQAINDLPLRNFVVLPFNVDHAMRCGILVKQLARDATDDRVRVKDDFKLIAQCDCEGISHLLSEDASTLVKYLQRVQTAGTPTTQSILLKDGFDAAWFDSGQKPLADNW
jgi:PIN domain nuclease of toxin-antitoxin system